MSANGGHTAPKGALLRLGRWVIVAALFIPLVTALLLLGRYGHSFRSLAGDAAAIELGVRQAWEGTHLCGAYSRFGWRHPGPLPFYILGLFYALGASSSLALYVGAGVFNMLNLAVGVRATAALLPGAAARLFAAVVAAVMLYGLDHIINPTGLTEVWNPVMTLIPLATFIALAAVFGAGRIEPLPALVFGQAFLGQSHIGYLLPTTLVLGAALWTRRGEGWARVRRERRWWIASTVLGCVLWLPVLGDQLLGSGNLGKVLHFFWTQRPPGVGVGAALLLWGRGLVTPLLLAGGATTGPGASAVGVVLAMALVVGLGLAWARARRRGATVQIAVVAVAAAMLAATLVSAFAVDDLNNTHLSNWFFVAGAWGWIAVAAVWMPKTLPRPVLWGAGALTAVLVLAVGGASLRTLPGRHHHYARFGAEDGRVARQLATRIEPLLAGGPQLRVRDHDVWPIYVGAIDVLHGRGIDVRPDPIWRFMLGDGLTYGERPTGQDPDGAPLSYAFALHRVPGRALVAKAGRAFVYSSQPQPLGELLSVPLHLTEHHGVDGAVDLLTDGATPDEGAPWNGPGAVPLSAAATLTFELPPVRLVGLRISADGNDTYDLEGSLDGETFEPIGELPTEPGWGLRTRVAFLREALPWRRVRVRAAEGDGERSIAEVTALASFYALRPTAASTVPLAVARRTTDGIVPRPGEAWNSGLAARVAHDGNLVYEIPEGLLRRVLLWADGNDVYELEASYDGAHFEPFGVAPPNNRPGLQRARVAAPARRLWSVLRVRPGPGDGLFSIAELWPRLADGWVIELGRPWNDGRLLGDLATVDAGVVAAAGPEVGVRLDVPAGAGATLMFSARGLGAPAVVEVSLGAARVGEVTLGPAWETFELGLPALEGGTAELWLRPVQPPTTAWAHLGRVAVVPAPHPRSPD